MAMIYCRECGKQISDQAPACPNCGAPQQTVPQNINPMQPIYIVKPKIPGRGLSIASLVLGIIAAVYGFVYVTSIIEIIDEGSSYFFTAKEKIGNIFPIMFLVIICAVLAISFAIASNSKGCTLKKKTAGLILGLISVVLTFMFLIIGLLVA